jgi:hypothetical protein
MEARTGLYQFNVTVPNIPDNPAMPLTFYLGGTARTQTLYVAKDYFSQKKRWWLRLHEKNGKLNEMPCHHKLDRNRIMGGCGY